MTQPTTPLPPWYREVSRSQWRSMFAAWIGYLLDGFDFVLITLVLTEISEDFGLSTVQAASLVSAAFISRWLGGAAVGALGDRFGRRAAMVTSILLYSLGSFACGFAWDYTSLFVARLAIGMGMAGEYGASSTYVLERWPARVRGRASGFLISGYYVGTVLAAQVYEWVVPHWGWRWMFYLGLVPVLVALYIRRSLPEADEWEAAVGERSTRPNPFRPLFATPARATLNVVVVAAASVSLFCVFTPAGTGLVPVLAVVATLCIGSLAVQLGGRRGWLLYLSLLVTVFAAFLYSWPIQALLPTYLKTELHYGAGQVTDVLYWAGFGTMVGCWVAGFAGDRLGSSKAYAITLLASLVVVFPVFATRDSLLLLGLLLFVLQALSAGISGLLPRYIGGHFPTESRGAALGFTYNVGALGGAVAPVLGAKLAEGMPLGTSLAVLTSGLTLVVIVLVGFDVPGRLHHRLNPDLPRDHLAPEASLTGTGPAAGAGAGPGAQEAAPPAR